MGQVSRIHSSNCEGLSLGTLSPQVFKRFDNNNSGTLELGEIMQLCRELGSLEWHEALFVQVR